MVTLPLTGTARAMARIATKMMNTRIANIPPKGIPVIQFKVILTCRYPGYLTWYQLQNATWGTIFSRGEVCEPGPEI
jgi:hypothetical protein